jgi:hypothetical protein
MTNGKSLAKMNQRSINALITFLVWIVFFHSTSRNAFVLGVQASQSPKMPSKTILFTNNGPASTTSSFLQLPNDGPVHFKQLPVLNSPAITTSSFLQLPNDNPAHFEQFPVPNDNSSFKQLSVPHDGPAHFKQTFIPNDEYFFKQLSVPHNDPVHFKQAFVPTTTTSTGLQAYNDHHSSLNDVTAPQAFSTTAAIMTSTMTQVPAITTSITKATLLKLDKCLLHPTKTSANNATIKSESLFLHAQFGSAS